MKTTYGERLRLAREHKGLTQEQLVKISGVKQGTISKIERGDQNSSGFDAELSYTLGVDVMWLKTGKDIFAPNWLFDGDGSTPVETNTLAIELTDKEKQILWNIQHRYTDEQKEDLLKQTNQTAQQNEELMRQLASKFKVG